MAIGIVQYNGHAVGGFDKSYDTSVTTAYNFNPVDGFDGGVTKSNATAGLGSFTGTAGVYELASNSTTARQGVTAQWLHAGFTATAGKPIRFEVKCSFNTAIGEVAIGMGAVDSSMIATSQLSNKFAGFSTRGDDDSIIDYVTQNATSAADQQVVAGVATTLDEDVVFAMEILPDSVDFFRNGLHVAKIAAQIPDGVLFPTIVAQSKGSAACKIRVKGFAVSQAV